MSISKDCYKHQNQENYMQNHSFILNIHKYLKFQSNPLQTNIYKTYTNLSLNRESNTRREEISL